MRSAPTRRGSARSGRCPGAERCDLDAILRPIRAYAYSADPRIAAANAVALLVAFNQPFYPLYVAWLVGDARPALFTFLSTPFFLAVPAVARRSPLAGRALLPLAGIGNTLISAKVFGVASGVEMFLAPCVVLAGLLFRSDERRVGFALMAIAFAAFAGLHARYGAPWTVYTAEQYAAFVPLNAVGAGGLMAFIGLTFSAAMENSGTRK